MSGKIAFNPFGNQTSLLHDVNNTVPVVTTDFVTAPSLIYDFRNQSKVTPPAANDALYRNFQPAPENLQGIAAYTSPGVNNAFRSTDNHGWFAPSFNSAIAGVNLDKKWTWTP